MGKALGLMLVLSSESILNRNSFGGLNPRQY